MTQKKIKNEETIVILQFSPLLLSQLNEEFVGNFFYIFLSGLKIQM